MLTDRPFSDAPAHPAASQLYGALAAAPLLQNVPVSVRPPDVATVAPVAVLIATVAVTACLLPARRAANVDPMCVLRSE